MNSSKFMLKSSNNSLNVKKWKEQGYVLYKELSKYIREHKLTVKQANKLYVKLANQGIRIKTKLNKKVVKKLAKSGIITDQIIDNISKQDFKKYYYNAEIEILLPPSLNIAYIDFTKYITKYLKPKTVKIIYDNSFDFSQIIKSSIKELKRVYRLEERCIDDILSFVFNVRDGKINLKLEFQKQVISAIIKYSQNISKQYGGYITFELIDKYLNENKIVLSEKEKERILLKLENLGIKLIDQIKENARFKKLITIGKKQGYLTYEYINKILLDEDLIDDKFNSFCIRLCEEEIKLIEVEKLLKSISKENFKKLYSDEKIKNLLPENLHITSNDFLKYLQPRTINAILKNFKGFCDSFDCSINELKKLKGFGYTTIEDFLYFVFNIRDRKIILESNNIQNNKNITDAILETFLKDNNISLEYITSIKNKIIKDIIKQKLNIEIFKNNIEKVFELKRNNINENLDKNIESSVNNITLNDMFNGLKERERDSFYLRYYENQTLQQIGEKYSVTREQTRQYIINAEKKLFDNNHTLIFMTKLLLPIEEEIKIKQIITKEDLYEQFKYYSNDKRQVISVINYLLKNKKYKQYGNVILSGEISIEKIKNFLEAFSVEPIEEIHKKLEINFNLTSDTIEKVFKILNKFIFKKGYFINPTIPNKVLYLFYIEQRPIHISELESLYKREFETKNNMHNLHAHVQNLQEIVLCGRGTYTLKTNVDSKILEDNEYLNKVINLLEDKNYELNVNVIKQETKTLYSISELILLLNSNDNFANLGRGYYGLKKWNYNNRKYIKDIIYEYMCKNMRPVSIGELLIYLEKQGKILNEYSLNGLLIHNEDIFKKHSFKKWELREYPSISLNLDENKLNTIKNDTKEIHNLLSEIFIDEKENFINDKATNIDLQQENTNNIDDFIKIIIEKNTWTKQELINIMKDKSVMISSVIDEINEWSNEQYGDFLLEEENSIYILNEDVRNLIMNKD